MLTKLQWVRDGHVFFGEAFIVPLDDRDLVRRAEEAARLARELDWRVNDLVIQFVRGFEAYDPTRQGNEAGI